MIGLPARRATLRYHGFDLVYSRGTSIVERLLAHGAYEPELIEAVTAELRGSGGHTLVDVGANVGLISLAVLAADPEARVFAFEPGRHQHDLLRRTIDRNRLAGRLELSPLALSDRAGSASFAVHSSRHASGDGFLDTGRAGRTRAVEVRTETLDGWWRQAGRPAVDVLKLDVEGAELLVLRGAQELLETQRPVVFAEAHPVNVAAYGHGVGDVRAELEARGYEVDVLGDETELVARPAG